MRERLANDAAGDARSVRSFSGAAQGLRVLSPSVASRPLPTSARRLLRPFDMKVEGPRKKRALSRVLGLGEEPTWHSRELHCPAGGSSK